MEHIKPFYPHDIHMSSYYCLQETLEISVSFDNITKDLRVSIDTSWYKRPSCIRTRIVVHCGDYTLMAHTGQSTQIISWMARFIASRLDEQRLYIARSRLSAYSFTPLGDAMECQIKQLLKPRLCLRIHYQYNWRYKLKRLQDIKALDYLARDGSNVLPYHIWKRITKYLSSHQIGALAIALS